ncbi:MAG TPA: hypothetical protein VGO58_15095 [Chitinophagaceae bacterium]|jgi:hypothetical protein|nr:hypothetical protein [Chitinophagaceae bacterium]
MKDNSSIKKLLIILLIISVLMTCVLSSGCSFDMFKTKAERSMDSAGKKSVITVQNDSSNSGHIKKDEGKSKEQYDYWKTTLEFMQGQKGDTTINNIYNYPQPTKVIYEGGKGIKEESHSNIDSGWMVQMQHKYEASLDSAVKSMREVSKVKESHTGMPPLFQLGLLGLGFIIINKVFGAIGKKYTITQKNKQQ